MHTEIRHCDHPGCSEAAVAHFWSALQEQPVDDRRFCERHAREYMAEYHAFAYPPVHRLSPRNEALQFEIELIGLYEDSDEHGIYLRGVDGTTRFFMVIGLTEAWTLLHYLNRQESLRPLTHHALAEAIRALGGTLQDVLIDSVDASRNCYLAKLRILQGDSLVLVDVRPSDAFIMAVLKRAPILIRGDVLQPHN